MALVLFVLADCATTKIHQAAVERGGPDKKAKLSNAALVAGWLPRCEWNAVYRIAGGLSGAPGLP